MEGEEIVGKIAGRRGRPGRRRGGREGKRERESISSFAVIPRLFLRFGISMDAWTRPKFRPSRRKKNEGERRGDGLAGQKSG